MTATPLYLLHTQPDQRLLTTWMVRHRTSDPGEALVDMDGISEGRNDAPSFELNGMPLPITHSDFTISKRKLAASRNGNKPLDLNMAEKAAGLA